MFTINVEGKIYKLYAQPVYGDGIFKPANVNETIVQCNIEGILCDQFVDKIGKNVADILLMDNLSGLEGFYSKTHENTLCIISPVKTFIDIHGSVEKSYFFNIDYKSYSFLKREIGNCANILVNMDCYFRMHYNKGIELFFDKKLEVEILMNRMKVVYRQLSSLYRIEAPMDLSVVYMKNIKQINELTGFDTTFAYKNKLVFLLYNRFHWQCEAHELSHIFLRDYGNPCFLLLEGLPSIAYELCVLKKKYNRYSCDIAIRSAKVPQRKINNYLGSVKTNRLYDGWDYVYASSFVLWLYKKYGMYFILELYQKLTRTNCKEKNIELFEKITGMNFEEAEKKWYSTITDI